MIPWPGILDASIFVKLWFPSCEQTPPGQGGFCPVEPRPHDKKRERTYAREQNVTSIVEAPTSRTA